MIDLVRNYLDLLEIVCFFKIKAGVQPSDEPGNCTPAFVVSEVWKNEPFSLHILGYRVGWEIIRGCL